MNKSFEDTPTAHNWHVWWWYNRCFACVCIHVVLDTKRGGRQDVCGHFWSGLVGWSVQYCHVLILNYLTYWVATWKIFRLHFLMVAWNTLKSLNFNRSCIFRVPASYVGLPECNWKMCLEIPGPKNTCFYWSLHGSERNQQNRGVYYMHIFIFIDRLIYLGQLLRGTRTAWAVRRSTGVHADSCGSPNNSLCTHLTGSRKSSPSTACYEYLTSCVGNHYKVDWKQLETVPWRPLENQNAADLMLDWCQQSTLKRRFQHNREITPTFSVPWLAQAVCGQSPGSNNDLAPDGSCPDLIRPSCCGSWCRYKPVSVRQAPCQSHPWLHNLCWWWPRRRACPRGQPRE